MSPALRAAARRSRSLGFCKIDAQRASREARRDKASDGLKAPLAKPPGAKFRSISAIASQAKWSLNPRCSAHSQYRLLHQQPQQNTKFRWLDR
jgi:hypothetical protein